MISALKRTGIFPLPLLLLTCESCCIVCKPDEWYIFLAKKDHTSVAE